MSDPHERLWERFHARARLGGRRLYENRMRTVEWVGPGGVKLSQAEKAQLFQTAVDDASGQMFEDIIRNRQKAGKLEGTKDIPPDAWEFLKNEWAKRQEQGG